MKMITQIKKQNKRYLQYKMTAMPTGQESPKGGRYQPAHISSVDIAGEV